MAMLVFSFVNFILYPAILEYQSGTQAGTYLSKHPATAAPNAPAYLLQEAPVNYSFEFYCPLPVERIPMDSLASACARGPVVVFAPTAFADTLLKKGYHSTRIQEFPNFHISQLTGQFVNEKTRSSALQWYSLLEVYQGDR